MKCLFLFVMMVSASALMRAQTTTYSPTAGYCQLGGTKVVTQGMNSTTMVQASYPSCQVKVYLTGTTNLQAIYSDKGHTSQLPNPFTATTRASWQFYSADGQSLDIIMSGGSPVPLPQTVTLSDVSVGAGGGGGGGNDPGGALYEIQSKQDTTTFGGTNYFTNQIHNILLNPARNSPQLSYCNGRQCGFVNLYGQDTATLNGAGVATGTGQSFYNVRNALFTGPGWFNGFASSGGNDPQGGGVIKLQDDVSIFHTEAIAQNTAATIYAGKPYDTAGLYMYIHCHGGFWGGGDEGCSTIRANGGNNQQFVGGFQVGVSTPTGATTLNYLPGTGNINDIMVGGLAIDPSNTPIMVGNVVAYDGVNHIVTVSKPDAPLGQGGLTAPASMATTTTPITIATGNAAGTSATVTAHLDSGVNFDPTKVMFFACSTPAWEFVIPTQMTTPDPVTKIFTITAVFQHGHTAGCQIVQGGSMGVLDLYADRVGNNYKTGYFVYAINTTQLVEVTYTAGARGFINTWRHNYGTGQNLLTTAVITGDGTNLKICNMGQSQYNFGGAYVRISGATPSGYNGVYLTSNLDASYCVTAPNTTTGPVTGATVQTGGDVNYPFPITSSSVLGSGGFYLWHAARIKQLGTTTQNVNGVITNVYNNQAFLYPNDLTVNANDFVISLDDPQIKLEPLAAFGNIDTAPNAGLNVWTNSRFAGAGVTGLGFIGLRVQNDNAFSMYKGGGGTPNGAGLLDGAVGMSIDGPFVNDIRMATPLGTGSAIVIYPNPLSTAGIGNNTYHVLCATGPGGNCGMDFVYNPNTGVGSIISGTGNGITSGFTLSPTSILFATSGALTLQSTSFTGTVFQGVGVRCVQAGTTGALTAPNACGTVTSVGLTVPAWATGGGTITSSGTFNLGLPAFVGSGGSHAPGVVPDPGASAGSSRYLNENGGFVNPLAGGFSGSCAPTTTATVVNGLITGCS